MNDNEDTKGLDALREQYLAASQVYINQENDKPDVIGIIVSGSLSYGTIDKNSDIDIYVILHPDCDYRERGNVWVNGIEIEYFKNPPAQIEAYFEREQNSPHTAHMLAYGSVVYSRSEEVEKLVAMATEIIVSAPPKLSPTAVEFAKYFLDDDYKDFEDAVLRKDLLGANLMRYKIVNRCIDSYCQMHQIRRGKDKNLHQQLEELDPFFRQHIYAALAENWQTTTALAALRTITENLLGGRRAKNWKMRSDLDV